MKKRFGLFLVIIMLFACYYNVNAEESIYYTNPNGVELTRDEYVFLQSFFFERYPEIMTMDDYNEFVDLDIMNGEIQTASSLIPGTFGNVNLPQGSYYSTANKSIEITSSCTTNCYISITANWINNPAIRSYDVIGAYLSGVSLLAHNHTYVSTSSGYSSYSNLKTASNGIGNSVKLLSGNNVYINQMITVSRGGTVFGSYQHAMQNVTLATSKNYSFSLGGYGSVFSFYGSASGVYDAMSGVNLSV